MLDYLEENGGKAYKNPEKANAAEKPVLLELKEKGRGAINTLKAIGSACSEAFGLFILMGVIG